MKTLLLVLTALFASVALAATIDLPDPSVYVNLKSNHTTVGINGKYYGAPSQFVYVSECSTPDSSRYHCDVDTESNVVLTATDGSTITVTITAQFAARLQTSGHNQWVQTETVLDGVVTL